MLSDGTELTGVLHPSLSLAQARGPAGGTLAQARGPAGGTSDLESACKQLLVIEASLWASVLKIRNGDTCKDELYISEVLPFDAVS